MKTFKKYANSVLLSAVFVAAVPTYAMETEETDTVEQVGVIKPARVAWYKKPAIKYSAFVAAGLMVTYAGTCWYKELSPMELAAQLKASGISALQSVRDYFSTFGEQRKDIKSLVDSFRIFFEKAYLEIVETMAKEYDNDIAMCKAFDCYNDASKQQLLQEYSDKFKEVWDVCSHNPFVGDEFKDKIWKLGHDVIINSATE